MAFEPGDLAIIPDDALTPIDDAYGLVFGFQQRSLLDMQFDKGAELARADCLTAPVADAVQRFPDRDPRRVGSREDVVGRIIARIRSRRHCRGRKTRTFLVGPVDDPD